MANCTLFYLSSNEIIHFIRDCRKSKGSHPDGWNYVGSNCKIMGVKARHFSEFWTEDIPIQNEDGTWNRKVSELTLALTYKGRPVSSRKDVDQVTREEIRKVYDLEDELKILRQKDTDPVGFAEYNNFIESLLSEAKGFKDRNFLKEVQADG